MKDNTILIFVLGVLILYNLYDLKLDRKNALKYKLECNTTKDLKKSLRIAKNDLKFQSLINLELNNITDKYQSSRKEKLRNINYLNLIDSIN